MKVMFVAQLVNKGIEISSENPENLLSGLRALGYATPTAEKLLMHLFCEGAAYCQGAYMIIRRHQKEISA